jgi:UDP-glucose 4-epimerase
VLITGGAGYIGSHALRSILAAGHRAVVVDDLRTGRAEFVGDTPLARCDIGDTAALRRVFEKHPPFDGVLHFAASTSVPESTRQPLAYYENNTVASLRLLGTALEYGVRAFVLSSTAAVYGNPAQLPVTEEAPCLPINPYGNSKLVFERMLADTAQNRELGWCALRYFNASGAEPDATLGDCRQPASHLVPAALEAACGLRERLELYGTDYPTPDGTCVRDYIHVTDLATAHVLALESLLAGGDSGVFNLGTGCGVSNRAVIDAAERISQRSIPVIEAQRRPGDPAELVADATRFGERFGWSPVHSSLDEIVETAWNWMRRNRGVS